MFGIGPSMMINTSMKMYSFILDINVLHIDDDIIRFISCLFVRSETSKSTQDINKQTQTKWYHGTGSGDDINNN